MSEREEALYQPSDDEDEAIRHFKEAIARGEHWYLALLEAISLWDKAEETVDGRQYRYLIAGEAFDWLTLAERLCEAVDGLVPEDEKLELLFHSRSPLEVSPAQFKERIGPIKYRGHLNYLYGVVVEEALQRSVESAIRKERRSLGLSKEAHLSDEVHRRIYGASQAELLAHFRQEQGYPDREEIGLTELKEFTYWLFKHRLAHCDQARVASDTRRALEELERMRASVRREAG